MTLAVGILAGGASARMGQPKTQVVLADGATMLEAMMRIADGIGVPALVCGPGGDLVDRRKNCGPVAGIEVLLCEGQHDRYLILPCDMPRLTAATLAPLATVATTAAYRGHALPALVPADAANACSAYLDDGGRSVHGLLAALDCTWLAAPADLTAFANINSPQDLDEAALEGGST